MPWDRNRDHHAAAQGPWLIAKSVRLTRFFFGRFSGWIQLDIFTKTTELSCVMNMRRINGGAVTAQQDELVLDA
jgi:hypothetical protein